MVGDPRSSTRRSSTSTTGPDFLTHDDPGRTDDAGAPGPARLSDREAVETLTFDLRWEAARGPTVIDTAFDPSTLTYRCRRLRPPAAQRVFELVAAVIAETGAVAGKTRPALDPTILVDDAVARQDTVTQPIAAVRET